MITLQINPSHPVTRTAVVALAALSVFVGTSRAAAGLEAKRVAQNATCLAKMHSTMRPKIKAVLADMEGAGYKPIIDTGVWRSPAQEAQLRAEGRSQVSYSYHMASTCDGHARPCTAHADSLAADITDQRWGWANVAPRAYWLRLANAGRVHQLYSGSYFGLSTANKARLRAALIARNFNYSGPRGWDPAHLEPTGITLGQAKAGKRPF